MGRGREGHRSKSENIWHLHVHTIPSSPTLHENVQARCDFYVNVVSITIGKTKGASCWIYANDRSTRCWQCSQEQGKDFTASRSMWVVLMHSCNAEAKVHCTRADQNSISCSQPQLQPLSALVSRGWDAVCYAHNLQFTKGMLSESVGSSSKRSSAVCSWGHPQHTQCMSLQCSTAPCWLDSPQLQLGITAVDVLGTEARDNIIWWLAFNCLHLHTYVDDIACSMTVHSNSKQQPMALFCTTPYTYHCDSPQVGVEWLWALENMANVTSHDGHVYIHTTLAQQSKQVANECCCKWVLCAGPDQPQCVPSHAEVCLSVVCAHSLLVHFNQWLRLQGFDVSSFQQMVVLLRLQEHDALRHYIQ